MDGGKPVTVQEIYDLINEKAPFSLQESWDRSGLLVGDFRQKVRKVLLTLDITLPVIEEAKTKQADLILSHHPVIWDPLRTISPSHPVWHLVTNNIAAISAHTNLDIAEGGLNDMFGDMLAEKGVIERQYAPFDVLSEGRVLGRSGVLKAETDARSLASVLKAVSKCEDIRYYCGKHADCIKKIAWCTGSGGDMIDTAIAIGADALITADCKHSCWADTQNLDFTMFDCGHFYTEVIAVNWFLNILTESVPELEAAISDAGTRPFFEVLK